MPSEPSVEVSPADADDLRRDSYEGQAAMGSPLVDGARFDAADVRGGRCIIQDFGHDCQGVRFFGG